MEAAEKISVGVIKEKTKSKAVKKEAEGMRVSTREKVCYGVGDIGANLVWTTEPNLQWRTRSSVPA